MDQWPHEKDQVLTLKERVDEAKRIALQEIKVWRLLFQSFSNCVVKRKGQI